MSDNQEPEMLKPADLMKKQSSPSVCSLQSVTTNRFFKDSNRLPQSTPLPSEIDPEDDLEDTNVELESCSSIVDFNSTCDDLQADATNICDIFKNIALNDLLQEDEDEYKFPPSSDETELRAASSSSSGYDSGGAKVLSASMDMKDFIALLAVDDPVYLLGFGEVITDPAIQLPFQDLCEGEMKIYISEMFSPVHFWFNQGNKLDSIMIQLKKDYIEMSDRALILSEKNFRPGLLVACYLEMFLKWHRAMVINPIDAKGYVRLLFIDYGTVGNVHSKKVKYLYAKYLKYPKMALRGRLHNLKPPNGQSAWSEEDVGKVLMRVANDEELTATVLTTDGCTEVHELDITSRGQNLRDWMIQKSIATPFELKTPNSNYPMCYFFPTFAMLEKDYPTFHEKSIMRKDELDFDLLLETNFLSSVKTEKLRQSAKLLTMLRHEKFEDAKEYYFPSDI